jgi:DNA polymerase III gamma/tau subunit
MSLATENRPKTIEELIGQPTVSKQLAGYFNRPIEKVPRVYLLEGATGSGKTTTAHFIKEFFKVGVHDFSEQNGAKCNGVNDARAIVDSTTNLPMDGGYSLILIDECHRLTKEAWDILLTPTEDVKDHVVYVFATTETKKIKKTIRDRCQVLTFKPLADKDILMVLKNICKKEEKKIVKDVAYAIVDKAEGSARRAISLLESVIDLPAEDRLEVVESATTDEISDELKKLLILLENRGSFTDMAKAIKEIKETPESIRYRAMAWMAAAMLRGGCDLKVLSNVIYAFKETFDGNDGKAKLVEACYLRSDGR